MENTSFSRVFEKNISKWSLNGWKALNYIFLDQKLPSIINISVENWQKVHLSQFSDRFLKFEPLPPPHSRNNWIFVTFLLFLSFELELGKIWLVLVQFEAELSSKTVEGVIPTPLPFVQEGLRNTTRDGGG